MGHCCAREPKPVITTKDISEADLEKRSSDLKALSLTIKVKRETLKDLQEQLKDFQETLKDKQRQVQEVTHSFATTVESAQDIYDSCVKLITRISILQTIAKNMRSEEFKPLLITQTLDSVVLSLLSSSAVPVGRQTHSLILSEIQGTTLDSSENDIQAIDQLKEWKTKGEQLKKSLESMVKQKEILTDSLISLDKKRAELFKNANLFSNDVLFFKDRRQEFLVKSSAFDEEIKKITKGLSPVALIQDLFSLESDDFSLSAEIAGLNSGLKYCEMQLKASEGKEERAGKIVQRIGMLPVPRPMLRPSVTVLGVAPKVVDDDSDVDLLEDEIAEQRAQAMYEEVQTLEARLQEARDSFHHSQRLSLKMEEQIEYNDFNKAELVLKLIATRLVHRVKLERIWLFSEWRLSSLEVKMESVRTVKKPILG